jgi:hypothetical protein
MKKLKQAAKMDSDIEPALDHAFHMSSIALTLAERAFAHTAESLGGLPKTYFMEAQDVDTLLYSLIEAHAQIRDARDQYCGISGDDAPAKAVAEAQ